MENSNTYQIKPTILSTILVMLVGVLLSCLFQTLSDFSSSDSKKVLTEKLAKDKSAERENSEEKEFLGEVLFSAEFNTTRFNNISSLIEVNKFECIVPQVSLDIPVPPPKNHSS